jgi:P-type Ca2+ transporter type 2C
VICLDKTGTITENKMQVSAVYDFEKDQLFDINQTIISAAKKILWYAALASETTPYDPMEIAIWEAHNNFDVDKSHLPNQVYEYELEGHPPMMTHVHELNGKKVVAAKGAIERILQVSHLTSEEQEKILNHTRAWASKGYRVIGVASAEHRSERFPAHQDNFDWTFQGMLSLYDPPKKDIQNVLQQFFNAGISVKLLTGDYAETALNIAHQVGLTTDSNYMTGNEVMEVTKIDLQKKAQAVTVFARMYPDAKQRVIEALQANGEIVAMLGDGVNDGPALKAANIGIALGERGTEIARRSADLIITNDHLQNIVEAIRQGRSIYYNLKKAIRYILAIHIPIILTASLPVILGWRFPNIFTPIHVIFLELIMGPTCSIFFEREPAERNILLIPPRKHAAALFSRKEITLSCFQGIAVAATLLWLYYQYMNRNYPLPYVRTIVFTTLLISNILLTFATRSFSDTIQKTIRYKNNLTLPVITLSISSLCLILFVPFARNLFELALLRPKDLFVCFISAFAAVLWFELYKSVLRQKQGKNGFLQFFFTDVPHTSR